LGSIRLPNLFFPGPLPPGKHALLVGCTKYPNLGPGLQLRGPGNDVVLMRELLVRHFGFPDDEIVTLAEHEKNKENRPMRGNIQREFQRLARVVAPGDEVVVLLAGHGSQQPDMDPDNPDDLEPDGLDEIFLPCDVGEWDGRKGHVANAISDDEIRAWLTAIQRAGASVWVIVDACHSGTMVRGGEDEVPRQVLPGTLVPEEALAEARRRAQSVAEQTRGGTAPLEVLDVPNQDGNIVALYAAQSTEPTVEKPLPPDADDAKPYGLLTYVVNQVLTQASSPLTYRELAQRVHQQYAIWGRTYPTPLLEGTQKDREVLGKTVWESRSRILLSRHDSGTLRINAGALVGMTRGSVLAVYPSAGRRDSERLLGHVRVTQTMALDSVVEPVAHGDMPAPDDLPDGARAVLVFSDYGPLRLCVAIARDPSTSDPAFAPQRKQLADMLEQLAAAPGTPVEVVDDPSRAQWLLEIDQGRLNLLPADGVVARGANSTEQPQTVAEYGRVPIDEKLAAWLHERLRRIARAQGLLATARTAASGEEHMVTIAVRTDVLIEIYDEAFGPNER